MCVSEIEYNYWEHEENGEEMETHSQLEKEVMRLEKGNVVKF